MRILITKDASGGEAWLTNESCASRYGIPVLEITAEDVNGTFGPSDMLGEPPRLMLASQIVAGWGKAAGRTEEEKEFAGAFLAQWPEGPQL